MSVYKYIYIYNGSPVGCCGVSVVDTVMVGPVLADVDTVYTKEGTPLISPARQWIELPYNWCGSPGHSNLQLPLT